MKRVLLFVLFILSFLAAGCEFIAPLEVGGLNQPCDYDKKCKSGLVCDETAFRCVSVSADGDETDVRDEEVFETFDESEMPQNEESEEEAAVETDELSAEGSDESAEAQAESDETIDEECACAALNQCCDGCNYKIGSCSPVDENAKTAECIDDKCFIQTCNEGYEPSMDKLTCEKTQTDGGDADEDEASNDQEIEEDLIETGDEIADGNEDELDDEAEESVEISDINDGDYVELIPCYDDESPCCKDGFALAEGSPCLKEQDALDCTFDVCNSAQECSHPVMNEKCLINGVCYDKGQAKPNFQCSWCDPINTKTAWTDKPITEPCDDDDKCTYDEKCDGQGACADGTPIVCSDDSGICSAKRACNGTSQCSVSYANSQKTCEDDGIECTTDHCDAKGVCLHDLQFGYCLIEGSCYSDRAKNPSNECQWCDAASDSWVSKPSTEACADDGKTCTTDHCNGDGECVHDRKAGFCLIEGGCYSDGTKNPTNECLFCDVNSNQTNWTPKSDNTDCAQDSFACTSDVCLSGVCSHPVIAGKCLAGGSCRNDGDLNPSSECQICSASLNRNDWTNKAEGTNCGDADSPCVNQDKCDNYGHCSDKGFKTNLPCDDNNACTHTDKCNANGACAGTFYGCSSPGKCETIVNAACKGDGTCDYPADTGAPCDDDDKCSKDDKCQPNKTCIGTSYNCDNPGPCQTSIGATCNGDGTCNYPAVNEGNLCNDDGDNCNGVKTCVLGVCKQTTAPVTCTALDQCHTVGMCEPTTGICSNPIGNEGSVCSDDGNKCNGVNSCAGGECKQTTAPIVCSAQDECHDVGECAPLTGVCSNPSKTNGTLCGTNNQCYYGSCVDCTNVTGCADLADDGMACSEPACNTSTHTCYHNLTAHLGELCGDTTNNTCDKPDTCDANAICQPNYQSSSTNCNDDELCTFADKCDGKGQCAGTQYDCSSPGKCETSANSTCNGDGTCNYPANPGAACDDDNLCTHDDQCQSNKACVGVTYSCGANSHCDGSGTCPCDEGFFGANCNQCDPNALGTYPDCFMPKAGFELTNQYFKVPPDHMTSCYDTTADCSAAGGIPAVCGDSPPISYCGQSAQYPDNARTFTCYNANGTVQYPCNASAAADETVVDSITGLEWQRKYFENYRWDDAVAYCNNLVYRGHDDWRLPTPHELLSISDNSISGTSLYKPQFPGSPMNSWNYWSSAVYTKETARAYHFDSSFGGIGFDYKNYNSNVRCVRGGKTFTGTGASERYKETGDTEKIVFDKVTGLQWTKTYATGKKWVDALAYCEALTYAGYSDWRLPKKNEIASLVDYSRNWPASSFPTWPTNGFHYFRSSTSSYSNYAWFIHNENGAVNYQYYKSETFDAFCVRGGP